MDREPEAGASAARPLAAFIDAAKSKGASDEFIVRLLKEHGWPEKEIYQTFSAHYEGLTGVVVPQHGAGAESAKEAFLYLVSFATLGTWTIELGSLLFTYIDTWLPDRFSPSRAFSGASSVATELASIIVAFPVYAWVQRYLNREIAANPEKRASGVRKWLSHLALFVAAGCAIADLITFIDYFIRGELTAHFVLKVITVLVIAGGVLWYYLVSLREGADDASGQR